MKAGQLAAMISRLLWGAYHKKIEVLAGPGKDNELVVQVYGGQVSKVTVEDVTDKEGA